MKRALIAGNIFEALPRDMRRMLSSYLTLASKRALMRASKFCYWWIKASVVVHAVPSLGWYKPGVCMICAMDSTRKVQVLPKRGVDRLVPSNGAAECEYGHRYLCHGKDALGPCPNYRCEQKMKRIKL